MSDVVFNDSCLNNSTLTTRQEALAAFELFLTELSVAIDDKLVRSMVRSSVSLIDLEICGKEGEERWRVNEWIDDGSLDFDMKMLLYKLDTKIPMEAEYPLSSDDEDELLGREFYVGENQNISCFPFGFALHTGFVLASISTAPIWARHRILGGIFKDGILIQSASVPHFSQPNHCELILEERRHSDLGVLKAREDFSEKKSEIFPQLQFSPEIDDQIALLSSRQIANLAQKLERMNSTARAWQEAKSATPDYQFSWRWESKQTMNKQEFRTARTFKLPNGESAIFEAHLDFSESHRIHYIEDVENKTFIIGYIGNHLPTVKYPH